MSNYIYFFILKQSRRVLKRLIALLFDTLALMNTCPLGMTSVKMYDKLHIQGSQNNETMKYNIDRQAVCPCLPATLFYFCESSPVMDMHNKLFPFY
jgi:hypothetical protein